jgi:hypothetical protein
MSIGSGDKEAAGQASGGLGGDVEQFTAPASGWAR